MIPMEETRGNPPFSSPESDYSPVLGQALVEQEGAFQGTRSRAGIPLTMINALHQEVLYYQNH